METKMIEFYGDKLNAVKREDGVYTPAKPVSESLKLAWQSQHRKLTSDPVFSEGVIILMIPGVDAQPLLYIRADLIPLWLVQISANKVDPALKDKLIRYQKEAAKILSAAFLPNELKTTDQVEDELDMIVRVASKMAEERRQRRLLEKRMESVERQVVKATVNHSNDPERMTALAYCRWKGLPVDTSSLIKFGKACSEYARSVGSPIGKIVDKRIGPMNEYFVGILQQVATHFFENAQAS